MSQIPILLLSIVFFSFIIGTASPQRLSQQDLNFILQISQSPQYGRNVSFSSLINNGLSLPKKPWPSDTLNLNALRAGSASILDSSTAVLQQQTFPSTFLPLCGNGKIDTVQDYQALPTSSYTLVLPASPLGCGGQGESVALTLSANEECDDGNRLDFDGCSADCMHADLWISSCELSTEINPAETTLEALLYYPAQNGMLLSTSNALYLLNLQPSPDDRAVRASLLQNKDFSVTDLFLDTDSQRVILYSASNQKLWQWANNNQLSQLKDLSTLLLPASFHAFQISSPNVIFINDEARVVSFHINSGLISSCFIPQGIPDTSVFLGLSQGNGIVSGIQVMVMIFNLTHRILVDVATNGTITSCTIAQQNLDSPNRNIFDDAAGATYGTLKLNTMPYNLSITGSNCSIVFPTFLEIVSPMGLWIEDPYTSARFWLPGAKDQISIAHFLGDPRIFTLVTNMASSNGIGFAASNAFDIHAYYDFLDSQNTELSTSSWQSILQFIIQNVTAGTPVTNLAALYQNPSLYNKVLAMYGDVFNQILSTRKIKSFAKQPFTKNSWAINNNRLFEISKSGVQLTVGDLCMPSGVALCPKCYWAPANSPCMPCSQKMSSWAWAASCSSLDCAASTGRRRLLQQQLLVKIDFAILDDPQNQPMLKGILCTPQENINWTVSSGGIWYVSMLAKDPSACMRELKPLLSQRIVIKPPQTTIPLPPVTNQDSSQPAMSAALIAGIISAGAAGVIVVFIIVYLCLHRSLPRQHPYQKVSQ